MERLCKLSNTARRCLAGMNGRGNLVLRSHQMYASPSARRVFSKTGEEVSSSNVASSSSWCWSLAMLRKSIVYGVCNAATPMRDMAVHYDIFATFHMPEVRCELRHVIEVSHFPRGVAIGRRVESERYWFMIGKHAKVVAFQEMSEMLDCQVDSKQLATESAIASLGGLQW